MPADLVDFEPGDVGCLDVLVALTSLQPQDEFLHLAPDGRPLRGQQRQSTTDHFVDQEQIEILSQLAVVALGGFLEHLQVVLELRQGREGGAVDAGQLLVALTALPVGARNREQPKGAELPGIRHVRAQAEVDEVAGPIHARRGLGDLVGDQLDLEWLVQPLEERDRLGTGDLLLHERGRLLDDLTHLRLDPWQSLGQQPVLEREVVVKTLVGRRTDADHCAGKEVQDGGCHHMRR